MSSIETLLHEVPLFAGLEPAQLELIAGCGSNVHFADDGAVPVRGIPLTRSTSSATGAWRWRRRPESRRSHDRDARGRRGARLVVALRAVPLALRRARAAAVRATAFDAACLRGKCDADPELGYALMSLRRRADRATAMDEAPASGHLWQRPQLSYRRRFAWSSGRARLTPGRFARARVGRASARATGSVSSRCSTPSARAKCRSPSSRTPTSPARSSTPSARSAG